MNRIIVFIAVTGIILFSFNSIHTREAEVTRVRFMKSADNSNRLIDDSVVGLYRASPVDTYNIVRFDFETSDWQGWTSRDLHAQADTFFHVDDFSGMGGGDFGYYYALEGEKSMWCGTRAGDEFGCSWDAAPGYGNNWNQLLTSDLIEFSGSLELHFKGLIHCEGAPYDKLTVEYEDDGEWVTVGTFGGYSLVDTVFSVDSATVGGITRYRFHFQSDGAWSDQDGLFNTDGAAVIDSVTVRAGGGYENFEDFESAGVGEREAGIWHAGIPPAFGKYAGLETGLQAVGIDHCNRNISTQLVFFEGSTELADQSVYPGLYITPRCLNGGGTEAPCQDEMAVSPYIDLTRYSSGDNSVQDADIPAGELSNLGGVLLRYTSYLDLPMNNLVFFNYNVRSIINGCPGDWYSPPVYYYWDTGYHFGGWDISGVINSPDDTIQVAFNVVDMCDVWGGVYGDCADHTPAPWIDNVRVQRYSTLGPQWIYRGFDLFQDTFPYQSASGADTCRSDAAGNIAAGNDVIRGDSVVVQVSSPVAGGLGTDPSFGGAAVYIHVNAENPEDGTSLAGPQLIGTGDGWMKYISDDGAWTKLRGDSARVGDPGGRSIAEDNYMFDLNDSLFTNGYIIEYYFSAVDLDGVSSSLPLNTDEGGCFEFSCLPLDDERDVLFVDDYHGRGSWNGLVQDYWDQAFMAVMQGEGPERYDVNSPTSTAGNGLASCIDAENLGLYYHTVIWDSGDLSSGTIGTSQVNDVQLLEDWFTDLHGHDHPVNILVMGERLMSDLHYSGAASFQSNVLGCELDRGNYYDCTGGILGGGIVYPKLIPTSGGCMEGLDNFCLDGGCPYIQRFDMLSLLGTTSGYALEYETGCESETKYAAVCNSDTTASGRPARAVSCAFSMMQVRDCDDDGALVRNEFLAKVLEFFGSGVNPDITDDDTPPAGRHVNRLYQNRPNPFNPSTEISFSLQKRSRVVIRVYDVRGRLINTLLDEVRNPGIYNDVHWMGRNSRGSEMASGVYFYRMRTGSFTDIRKMILLR